MTGAETNLKGPEPVVVFQAINSVGLGHISRLAAIARAFRGLAPSSFPLFVVAGNDHGLLDTMGLPKMPMVSGREMSTSAWGRMSMPLKSKLAMNAAAAILSTTGAKLVVFDSFPEFGMMRAAELLKIPFVVVLRKMAPTHIEMYREPFDKAELILLPHTREEMTPPAFVKAKSRYVGTIVRHRTRRPRAAIRPVQRVLITGGGGGYPGTVDFYNSALEAIARCRAAGLTVEATLVTGPLFSEWSGLRMIADVGLRMMELDFVDLLTDGDVVICQAGYNTVAEVTTCGVPAICVPAPRDADDQFERAATTASTFPNFTACTDSAPDTIASALGEMLARRPAHVPLAERPKGDRAAAAILLDLIERLSPPDKGGARADACPCGSGKRFRQCHGGNLG